jgi:hypothetical protein
VEKSNGIPELTKSKVLARQCSALPIELNSISTKESACTVKPPIISGALNNEANSSTIMMKDDLSIESDPVKLERKRRQQQKKEEFLQQMKRHKSEDGAASTVSIKSEQTSPIPEGSYSHVDFNSIVLHCGLSDILAKTTLTS